MQRSGFIGRSLEGFVRILGRGLESEELAKADGLLQHIDPRVKVVGLPALIAAAVVARKLAAILAIFALSVLLAICSRISVRILAVRVWGAVLIFTSIIAVPAIFLTPGRATGRVPMLEWSITAQGLHSAAYLLSRAETAATLSLLLVLCTPWTHLLKAFRVLRVPMVMVVILGMTYRYIFLLLETAAEMFESRRSRMLGALRGSERRRIATATAGVLLAKTFQLSHDVYLAMLSRGFNGEVYLLSDFTMRRRDVAALFAFLALATTALWLGR